jgi:hypothetical protein
MRKLQYIKYELKFVKYGEWGVPAARGKTELTLSQFFNFPVPVFEVKTCFHFSSCVGVRRERGLILDILQCSHKFS